MKLIAPIYPTCPVSRRPKAPRSIGNKGVHLPRLTEALNEIAEIPLTTIYLVRKMALGLTRSAYCSILKGHPLLGKMRVRNAQVLILAMAAH